MARTYQHPGLSITSLRRDNYADKHSYFALFKAHKPTTESETCAWPCALGKKDERARNSRNYRKIYMGGLWKNTENTIMENG
jgi:hypothetical protein